MNHTPPTPTTRDTRPTFGEMLEEVMNLSIGFVVVSLPFMILFLPGIVLFIVMPAILLLAVALPLAVIGAVLIGPPLLLARGLRRRRARTAPTAAVSRTPTRRGHVRSAGRRIPARPHTGAG